ncbi:hypothetical protein Areg01_82090 [Actinoplanes regularis]|nr:hypothetical protein Areg01_82090 [Actinoplanes regularis]
MAGTGRMAIIETGRRVPLGCDPAPGGHPVTSVNAGPAGWATAAAIARSTPTTAYRIRLSFAGGTYLGSSATCCRMLRRFFKTSKRIYVRDMHRAPRTWESYGTYE